MVYDTYRYSVLRRYLVEYFNGRKFQKRRWRWGKDIRVRVSGILEEALNPPFSDCKWEQREGVR